MKKINIKFNENNKYIIEILRRRNINIYDVRNNTFTIKYTDLDKIPKYYIKSEEYIGLQKFKIDLINNKTYILIVFLSFMILILASHMIFKVEIMHNDKKLRNIVREYLKENGVAPFTFKKSYKDIDRMKKEIKKAYSDQIDWIEIERKGVVYKVKLEEKIIVKNNKERPLCDIISTKDANIIKSSISKGEMLKDLGDFVSKGEVIVSGTVKFDEKTTLQTCAEGEIFGNTWYKINVNMPLRRKVKHMTKRHTFNIGFERGSKYTRIFKIHFDNYEVKRHKIISLGKITLYFETVNEYDQKVKQYKENVTLKLASKMAREKLKVRLNPNAQILYEKVLQSDVYNSIMYIEFFYSVSEPIGKQVTRELPEKGVEEDEITR